MLFPAPSAPAFAADQATQTERFPRYEDCTQDGRLMPIAIPPALSALWETVLANHRGARSAASAGVLALLTRLTVSSLDQPIRVDRRIEATVGFELAHDRDERGEVSRLFTNVWADVRGFAGRTNHPHAGHDAQLVLAGQAFAEHTFTRPFGPPAQRRVTDLADLAGYPALPETRYHQPSPHTAGEAPDGATWLDELAPDVVDTRFTLDQTDANQHVNSLVYVRMFLDAAQRRLASGEHPAQLRSKAFDVAYRKPSFAGERVRAHLRMFALGDLLGAAGFICAPGEESKPRCYIRVLFGA